MERVLSTAFLYHNYGNSQVGARADIENMPIERLRAFYRKYYQPDNAVLVVTGRFDPERAVALIEEKFGPIPRPDRGAADRLYETYTAGPVQDGERTGRSVRTDAPEHREPDDEAHPRGGCQGGALGEGEPGRCGERQLLVPPRHGEGDFANKPAR